LGSYGPAAGSAEAVAIEFDVAVAVRNVGSDAVGRAVVAAFVVAFGDDVSLSASESAALG
jgi:hypothetical protein